MATLDDPWSGALQPGPHDKLVANIIAVSARAGLGQAHRHLIWYPADLSKAERQWAEACVKSVHNGSAWDMEKLGIVFTQSQSDALRRMQMLAGFLIRNFVDARILSRSECLLARKEDGGVDAQVLFIPDFITAEYIETIPKWERSSMTDLYSERVRATAPTCLFAGCANSTLKSKLPTIANDMNSDYMVQKS